MNTIASAVATQVPQWKPLHPTIQPNGEHVYPKSDFHYVNDVPLKNADGTYNAVVEIGAGHTAKIETGKDGHFKHDHKKGAPRFINFLPYPADYGYLPQTWSDPKRQDHAGHLGDGDPIDTVVLNAHPHPTGAIQKVRVIGGLEFVDNNERDTKIIAVPVEEPSPFKGIETIQELYQNFTGTVEMLSMWFSNYKNTREGVYVKGMLTREEAEKALDEAHADWHHSPYKHFNKNA